MGGPPGSATTRAAVIELTERPGDLSLWWRRLSEPLGLVLQFLLALVVLTVVSLWMLQHSQTPLREQLGSALLGAAITTAAALGAAALSYARVVGQRREVTRLQALERQSQEDRGLEIGRMRIPHVVVVASAAHGRSCDEHTEFVFEPGLAEPRRVDDHIANVETHRLPRLRRIASEQNVVFTDDPCLDLVRARLEARNDDLGVRRRRYVLTAAQSSYYRFAATAGTLDDPLDVDDLGVGTLREQWDCDPQRLESVSDLPSVAKIGVGTLAVTNDARLVLGVRGHTWIVGAKDEASRDDDRQAVHVVAEGMLPSDTDHQGRLSPYIASRRALAEELGVESGGGGLSGLVELTMTGVFLDRLRWQPCFSLLARLNVSFDELAVLVAAAPDFWETDHLVSFPFDVRNEDTKDLLLGRHRRLRLASNHAAAVLYFGLLHQHGLDEMRLALSWGARR